MFKKLFRLIMRHKIIALVIALAIAGAGYYSYKTAKSNSDEVRYVLAAIKKGTLIVSISGSGQVSASNQIDIKPKVSGEVVFVDVKNGQEVKTETLLLQIDSHAAQKTLRDAKTSLETAKLELEELLQPADAYSLMQAENTLIQAKDSLTKLKFTQESNYQNTSDAKQKAEDNLKKAYEDGFNATANVFLDLPGIMAGLNDMLFTNTIRSSQWNIDYYADSVKAYDEKVLQYRDDAYKKYNAARSQYDQNFSDYKSASRFSERATIEKLIDETYDTTKLIAEAVKSANNLIQFYQDKLTQRSLKPVLLSDTHLSSLGTYTSKTNSHLSSLLGIKRTVQDNKETIANADRDIQEMNQNQPLEIAAAERTIKEKEESLAKLKADPDELDIRAKKIAIQQKEDALLDAQQSLADHYIRAPFDGTVAKVNVKKGESVSSNAVATLITKQKIAEITLNEVDVAKVKVGQKVTITFDAVENLTITGEVVEVDTLGAVSQGVVTYGVKIAFDTQDERVKPGMSVSAAIITDVKQDALLVPSSAIKQEGDVSYVEIMPGDSSVLQRQSVTTGLSNDMTTEILSGLKQGDKVVTQTITSSASQTQSQSSSSFRIPGIGGGGMR